MAAHRADPDAIHAFRAVGFFPIGWDERKLQHITQNATAPTPPHIDPAFRALPGS